MMVHYDPEFYRGKRVFVTGHTGFKGSWLCKMLLMAGAEVTGYSLQPPTQPNLFSIAGVEDKMHSVIGDIRDFDALKAAFDAAQLTLCCTWPRSPSCATATRTRATPMRRTLWVRSTCWNACGWPGSRAERPARC